MRWRDFIELLLAVLGVVLVLGPVVLMAYSWVQVGLVVAGLLMLEAGIWGAARAMAPEGRIYGRLRDQVDRFLEQVRELNAYAVEGDEEKVAIQQKRLHETVDGIVEAAGDEG